MLFNGFISYSHAADGRLAPAVQRGLHRLAKPWNRRRALWIFRDQTGLSVTPALWKSIQDALDSSDYFVLMASPEAAQSPWVNREITHWTETKSADRILPVLTDGEWEWDRYTRDFTPESTAVPLALRGVFTEEPLFLDLRWARGAEELSLQHLKFRDAIAQLAAPMHGVSKDELAGEDVRQYRRARRLQLGGVSALLILALLASVTGVLAVRGAQEAARNAQEALRQQKAAVEQHASATKYANEAQKQQTLAAQQQVKAADARAEAKQQQALADSAAAEAALQQHEAARQKANAQRQRKVADQAAQRAKHQQQLAKASAAETKRMTQAAAEQQQKATEASAEAAAAAAEATRMTQVANEQQKKAEVATAEAAKQQAQAVKQQKIAVSRRLVNQAQTTIGNDPLTALRLGIAAQSIQPDAEIKSAFAGVVASTYPTGTINDVKAVASAPDGTLAALDWATPDLSLWNVDDVTNPVRLGTVHGTFLQDTFAMSPDGRTVVVIDAKDRFRQAVVWDVRDRSHPAWVADLATNGDVLSLAFSADSKTLVTGDELGETTLWNLADPRRPALVSTITDGWEWAPVTAVGISADRRTLIQVKGGLSYTWDVTDPARPELFSGTALQPMAAMAFQPNAPLLAVGQQAVVNIWDLHDLNPATTRPPSGPPGPSGPEPSSPGPSSEPAPPSPPGKVTPAPVPAANPLRGVPGPGGSIDKLILSADGKRMAASDLAGNVLIWDTTNKVSPLALTKFKITGRAVSLAFSPDAKTLVTVDNSSTALLWRVSPAGSPDRLGEVHSAGDSFWLSAFSPDGRTLAGVHQDGTAAFFDLADPGDAEPSAELDLHTGQLLAVAASPDLRTIAAIDFSGRRVTLTDVSDPARPVPLRMPDLPGGAPSSVAFSPDGKTVVLRGDHLTLLDLTDRRHPRLTGTSAEANSQDVGPLAYSPDGKTIAVASGRGTVLWNVPPRSAPVRISTLPDQTAPITGLAFSPDGHTLATTRGDRTSVIWDVTQVAGPQRLGAIGSDVESVAFSPDGHTLVTTAGGTTYENLQSATLWDLANRASPLRLATFRNNSGATFPITFSPDGDTLISGKTLWGYRELNDLREDPAGYACRITKVGLSRAEWAALIPEIDYRPTCAG